MLGGRSRRSGDALGIDSRGICNSRLRCIAILGASAIAVLFLWGFLLPSDPTPSFPVASQSTMGELHDVRTALSQHKTDISALQQTIAHLQNSLQEALNRPTTVPTNRLDSQESDMKDSILQTLQKSIHGQIGEVAERTDSTTNHVTSLTRTVDSLAKKIEYLEETVRLQDSTILNLESQLLGLSGRLTQQEEKQIGLAQKTNDPSPSPMPPVRGDKQEKTKPEVHQMKEKSPEAVKPLISLSAPESISMEEENEEPITANQMEGDKETNPFRDWEEEEEEEEEEEQEDISPEIEKMESQPIKQRKEQNATISTGDEDLSPVVVIIPDFGAFADRFSAGDLKIGACAPEFTSGPSSVDKALASVEAIDDLRSYTARSLSIILATTPTRASYFDALTTSDMEIVYADDGLGYGDLCNEAVEIVEDEDTTLVFLMPGAIPTSLDFLTQLIDPLYDDNYVDVGIVMSKALDFWAGTVAHAGTNVLGNAEEAVPYLQYQGVWPNDLRTNKAQFVPVASPYGAWAIPVSVYRAVGGMLSDRDLSYTPSLAVYDLCLAVAQEADHPDEDLEDDDEEGVCSLQERHRVFYQPDAVVEVQIEACEEALLTISRDSEERQQFRERWSTFLWERYLAPKRQTELVVGWDMDVDDAAYCHDAVLTLTALDQAAAARVVPPTGTLCVGSLSREGSNMLTLLRDTDQEAMDIDVIVTPVHPLEVQHHLMARPIRQLGEPQYHVARLLEWNGVTLDEEMREGLNSYDHVWVATDAIRTDLLSQGLSESRTHVLPLTVDTYFFNSTIMEGSSPREEETHRALYYLTDPSQMVLLSRVHEELVDTPAWDSIREVAVYAPSLAKQGRSLPLPPFGEDVKVTLIKEKQSLRELAQLYQSTGLYVPLQHADEESAEERLFRLQAQAMGVPIFTLDHTLSSPTLPRPEEIQATIIQLISLLENE